MNTPRCPYCHTSALTMSTPGGYAVQEGALPGNKPASGASSGGRA